MALDSFERQVVLAAIHDLGERVAPALQDPSAAAALEMTRRLLAHALVRSGDTVHADTDAEGAYLASQEREEDAALAPAASAALTAESLTLYLRQRLGPEVDVLKVRSMLGGFSKQTYIVNLRGADKVGNAVVIRRDQDGGPVQSLAADEWGILDLMHRHGIPVAEPLWADRDFPLGGSIVVTRRIEGSSPYDATGSAALGTGIESGARALAAVLAKIHRVPPAELGASVYDPGASLQDHVRRTIALYEAQWMHHRTRPSCVLEEAFTFLKQRIPEKPTTTAIVHGDASLRNLLIKDGAASGLLDWELWHLGDPNEDLAYCKSEVEQAMPWEQFLGCYRAMGGVAPDPDAIAYYGVFGAVRNAVFGESCLHGFARAQRPECRFAFAAVYHARKLMSVIPELLRMQRFDATP